MVGNDIVDLTEAKKASNWERPRFLDKLFTPKEQHIIHNSENAFLMVWRLWSMKEAAYKLYTQQKPRRFYNPQAFECAIKNSKGTVSYKDFCCYTKTKLSSNYVISEARLQEREMTSEVVAFDIKNTQKQSAILKLKLLEMISESYELPLFDLNFRASKFGVPTVTYGGKIINVSLTHHGKYGAFVAV
jgi:phosphopantetheinyl transferase (holo-ACP synthase)